MCLTRLLTITKSAAAKQTERGLGLQERRILAQAACRKRLRTDAGWQPGIRQRFYTAEGDKSIIDPISDQQSVADWRPFGAQRWHPPRPVCSHRQDRPGRHGRSVSGDTKLHRDVSPTRFFAIRTKRFSGCIHSAMIEQQPDKRWDAILRMLESVAALDFSRRLTISDKADNIDALASGLNMLSEELVPLIFDFFKKSLVIWGHRGLERCAVRTASPSRGSRRLFSST